MDVSRRWVYIAVEMGARELDSRILLAAQLAKLGAWVLVGRRADLQSVVALLAPGAYIDTNLPVQNPDPSERVRILEARHHRDIKNVVLDEEGLIYRDIETYLSMRTTPELLRLTDLFVTWGALQAEQIRARFPWLNVEPLGNPRVDLLREPLRAIYGSHVEGIQHQVGRYVLFPSNFALTIHAAGEGFVDGQMSSYGWRDDVAVRSFLEDRRRTVTRNMKRFVRMFTELASRTTDFTIVIRPHPADDPTYWIKMTADLKNCVVDRSGSATPWLLGAEAVVHSGCTTGLEAYIAGTSAFTLRRVSSPPKSPLDIPDAVSWYVADADELLQSLNGALDGLHEPPSMNDHWLSRYVLSGRSSPLFAESVLELTKPTTRRQPWPQLVGATNLRHARLVWSGSSARRVLTAGLRSRERHPNVKYGATNRARRYYRQRLPNVPLARVRNILAALALADRNLSHVRSMPVSPGLVLIRDEGF